MSLARTCDDDPQWVEPCPFGQNAVSDAAGSVGYGGPPEGTPCAGNGEHVYRTLMTRFNNPPESSLG